jgi:hypothetical protein
MPRFKSGLKTYIEEHGKLPPDCVLGHIAWFTVGDDLYDAKKISDDFDKLGLNPSYLPPSISPTDAFLKASTDIGGFEYAVAGDNTARVLIRDVVKDKERVIRHIVREVVDAKNVQLLYEEVGELTFYKPAMRNGHIDNSAARYRVSMSKTLVQEELDILGDLVAKFEAEYIRHRDFHDGQKIRGVVRNYLLYLNGIAMKPSVYFVHNTRADELENLQTFVNGLSPTGLASLTMLPLADLPSLRTEVVDTFQREAVKDLERLAEDIVKVRATRTGPITDKAYGLLRDEYNTVMAKATEYTRVLQISQNTTAGAAETVADLLSDLQSAFVKQMDA